ncbi:MAG: hypothetical protein JHC71_12715 [Blastococcus sp.]|nr:hypothetical protein [Blastococcus sp.]
MNVRFRLTLGHIATRLAALAEQETALPADAYLERAEVRDEIASSWRLVALADDLPEDEPVGRLLLTAADTVAKRSADLAIVWRVMADARP